MLQLGLHLVYSDLNTRLGLGTLLFHCDSSPSNGEDNILDRCRFHSISGRLNTCHVCTVIYYPFAYVYLSRSNSFSTRGVSFSWTWLSTFVKRFARNDGKVRVHAQTIQTKKSLFHPIKTVGIIVSRFCFHYQRLEGLRVVGN